MEENKKGSMDSKKSDDKGKKPGAVSAHTTPGKPKRHFSEVANSSAEELAFLSQQIEDMSSELLSVKDSNIKTKIMKVRSDMKTVGHRLVEDVTMMNT